MFNSYNKTKNVYNNTLKINACSGGIYKTFRESWFKRVHLNSELMESLSNFSNVRYKTSSNDYILPEDKYYGYENAKPIVVLQMVICGDMEVIAEIIYKEDFDKYFINDNEVINNE